MSVRIRLIIYVATYTYTSIHIHMNLMYHMRICTYVCTYVCTHCTTIDRKGINLSLKELELVGLMMQLIIIGKPDVKLFIWK